MKHRDLDHGEPLPDNVVDALMEFVSTGAFNFKLRIKPGDATRLELPAGAGNDQVGIGILGRWRFNAATVERVSPGGAARTLDVHVTASDNDFDPPPGEGLAEIDNTVYTFALAITEVGVAPAGVDLSRKVGDADWDGAAFTRVDVQVPSALHAGAHAVGGSDPITPASIGAATAADVAASVAAETAARIAGDANNPTAGEKAALAGTSGAPGGGNRYVTDADARNTNARTPIAHATSHEVGGSDPGAWGITVRSILDVGVLGQTRAGRELAAADFVELGLAAPVGVWHVNDESGGDFIVGHPAGAVADSSGNARPLTNKGGVVAGKGITGAPAEAAVFAGSTAQALYRNNEGPLQIVTGAWGCWFRTAKRSTQQFLVTKRAPGQLSFGLLIDSDNALLSQVFGDVAGATQATADGATDVCDDRWHFVVVTHDGTMQRIYLDGVLEASVPAAFEIAAGTAPFNLGAHSADAATAAATPFYGRIDEAFLLNEVPTEDQIRMLMSMKLAHGALRPPRRAGVTVRRRRRGSPLAVADFTAQGLAQPKRLYNVDTIITWPNDLGSDNQPIVAGADLALATGPDGKANSALHLDGVNDFFQATDVGLPAGTATRTLFAWFKTTLAASQAIIVYGNAATVDEGIFVGSTGLFGSVQTASTRFVADGQWHFGAMVCENAPADGLKEKLYLDGQLVAGTTTVRAVALVGGATGLRLGARQSGSMFFRGQLARAGLTNYAMGPDQLAAIYAKGSQDLGLSPYPAGEYVERVGDTFLYVLADRGTLDDQEQVELEVAA